jgi:outer membrane protein
MLALLIALLAQSPPERTATIRVQQAIVSTAEGRRAAARMNAEWSPKLAELAKREADLKTEWEKLEAESRVRHGLWPFRHAMSAKRKIALKAALDAKGKALTRERDDDRAIVEKDRTRIFNNLGGKMRTVVERYASEKGYSVVLEAGSQESNVIVGRNDITSEIIRRYDETYPVVP